METAFPTTELGQTYFSDASASYVCTFSIRNPSFFSKIMSQGGSKPNLCLNKRHFSSKIMSQGGLKPNLCLNTRHFSSKLCHKGGRNRICV
jgi:hypothetical protein